MQTLEGKVALVTGASSGIGESIAKALAAEGAAVVLVARNFEALVSIVATIHSSGNLGFAIRADVTNEADVQNAFEVTLSKYSRLDLLVNNAGIFDGAQLPQLSLDTWERVLAVNLRGPFLCTREAMRIMQRQRGGRIINIGSLSAKRVRPNAAAYCASKHGLLGLTQATALEGRSFGIACGILHPGNVAVKRMGHIADPAMAPAVIAGAVVSMASLPADINVLESTVLPVGQLFIGRG